MERFQITVDRLTFYVVNATSIGTKRLKPLLRRVLIPFGCQLPKSVIQAEFSLNICGAKKITSLNRKYRHKCHATDVLSFPIHHEIPAEPLVSIGDIFVCKDVAIKQANEFEISLEEEIIHLLVHGFLHLLGYDHEQGESERKLMERLEAKILKEL